MRIAVHAMVKIAATLGSTPAIVPTTVPNDKASTTCLVDSEASTMSALPCAQGFIYPAVRIIGCLCRCQLLFHARHPSAEAIFARTAFGLRRFQPRFPWVVAVIRRPAFCVQTALWVFPLRARPCRGLSHRTPSRWLGQSRWRTQRKHTECLHQELGYKRSLGLSWRECPPQEP